MSSGARDYTEAKRILAGEVWPADDPRRVVVGDLDAVVVALVHAVLALAAATAEASPRLVHNHNDRPSAWWTALHGEEGR